MADLSKLIVSSSPHIRHEDNTRQIMLDVSIALMPALAIAIYVFGLRALTMTLVSVAGCVFFEWLYQALMHRPVTIDDCSAVVTGILLAFCLPASSPMWMVLIGDAFAIIVVKQLFGGIGKNFMNPALSARAFLMSFPVLMTTFPPVRTKMPIFASPDVVSAATPLANLKQGLMPDASLTDMALGMVSGSLGEISALALLAGGLYLLSRKVITLHTPLSFLATVALLSFAFPHGNGRIEFMLAQLCSGGLMLGAIFMATDYSTSPVTKKGQVIFGVGCGLLTVFIRFFGNLPEGVSYSILVMNSTVFLIEKLTKPRKYGYTAPQKAKKPRKERLPNDDGKPEKDLLRLGGALLAITAAVALCLGCVDTLTRDKITRIKEENIQNAMREVCGEDAGFEQMTLPADADPTVTSANRILRQGKPEGFCLQVEPMGFGGAITMIVGVDGEGAVLGVQIVELSETPGLGAKADDEKWLAQYQGVSGQLNVVKAATGNEGDIAALSGATITSKGVTAGVQTALDFAADQQ